MIRVTKPASGPPILARANGSGARATNDLKQAYDEGQREFTFKSSIYAARSVKNKLIALQHGKCCFCESRITHISYGDVEHFRPKAGFVQEETDSLSRPGYYWLAYSWGNLFLSCTLCNQRHKRNLFPLMNSSRRARSHHHNLGAEQPVFIDPSDDDPEQFIGFRDEQPYGKDPEGRGRMTIVALGLDRVELETFRSVALDLMTQDEQ